jgi:hypothetical protein
MLRRLFGRRPRAERDEDRVWLTRDAKLRGLLAAAAQGARVIAHFSDTRRALQALAREHAQSLEVTLAAGLAPPPSPNPELSVVVAERHPLREHDERLTAWADAAAGRIGFHVSLEDPLLAVFVGESLRPMLEKLGMTADAPLENGMVSRGIEGAQERVKRQAKADLPADSAEAWLRANGFDEPR